MNSRLRGNCAHCKSLTRTSYSIKKYSGQSSQAFFNVTLEIPKETEVNEPSSKAA